MIRFHLVNYLPLKNCSVYFGCIFSGLILQSCHITYIMWYELEQYCKISLLKKSARCRRNIQKNNLIKNLIKNKLVLVTGACCIHRLSGSLWSVVSEGPWGRWSVRAQEERWGPLHWHHTLKNKTQQTGQTETESSESILVTHEAESNNIDQSLKGVCLLLNIYRLI